MIGLYSIPRREEILALQWIAWFLDVPTPYVCKESMAHGTQQAGDFDNIEKRRRHRGTFLFQSVWQIV